MNDERKFNIEDFDEYIRQGEPDKKEKAYIWQMLSNYICYTKTIVQQPSVISHLLHSKLKQIWKVSETRPFIELAYLRYMNKPCKHQSQNEIVRASRQSTF